LNNSKEIPRKQTTSHEDYFQDGRLEAGDNGKVPSILIETLRNVKCEAPLTELKIFKKQIEKINQK